MRHCAANGARTGAIWIALEAGRSHKKRNMTRRGTLRGKRIDTVGPQTEAAGGRNSLEVFELHRALLFSIAYRMLGSAADAEDMLQETFLRWQQTAGAAIEFPRAFLVTILSRLCINHLQSARVRREEYFGAWLPEPVLTGPAGDPCASAQMDESLSMAFLLLLERLTPIERAVFLLREVFDYEYSEIAGILAQSEANCRQILRRARQHVTQGTPRFDSSPQQHEKLLQEFAQATERGDMQGLLELLSSDVVLYADGGGKASAVPNPIYGPENVARRVLLGSKRLAPTNLVRRMEQINGLPGIVSYLEGHPYSVFALDVVGGRVRNIYIVTNPDKLAALPRLSAAPC
jgi:RNA polymerase sigma-70 factor (ECF subfamily)